MVKPSSIRRSAGALVFACAVGSALVVAAPGAHGQIDTHPPLPSESTLADEPFLVQYETALYSAGGEAAWVADSPAPGESIEDAYERLNAAPDVRDVAFNYRYQAHGSPDDPLFGSQWHLQRINTTAAWERGDGTGVTVAVLDSGIGTGGEDLVCHEFVDPYNAITHEFGLDAVVDDSGHGTHVTGTIGQCTNNGIGTAGVAPGASIMPIKVMDSEAQATTLSLYRGMTWAIDHGADVMNLSLGRDCADPWPLCSDTVIDFLTDRSVEAGVVVVASSGNAAVPYVSSPANNPSAISVGATTVGDERAPYSSYGVDLDVVAPGGSIRAGVWQETFDEDGVWDYYERTGTSMAAPHVAGTAALMRSVNPTATPEHIRDVLTATAVDLDEPGRDELTGFGMINAEAAVDGIRYNPGDPCPIDRECSGTYSVDFAGSWALRTSLREDPATEFYYGSPGDVPFSGDWDCTGERTPGLYRQSDGLVYLRNSNTQGVADYEFFFGDPGDIPIAGDFNGDGCDTVSLYRASEGRVYVINRLGEDGGGLGAAELSYYFGDPGDKPFAGDFDGDASTRLGCTGNQRDWSTSAMSTPKVWPTRRSSTATRGIRYSPAIGTATRWRPWRCTGRSPARCM